MAVSMTQGANPKDVEAMAKESAEAAAKAFAFNMQMGRAFMDAWSSALAQMSQPKPAAAPQNPWMAANPWLAAYAPPQPTPPPAPVGNGPFADASRIWLNAVSEAMRRTQEAMQRGETLAPDAYLDLWSKAAAELSQAVVSDAAFATMTGHWVNQVATAKTDAKKRATEQLRELGFSTHADVDEVGKRLVELERRVHELTLALEAKSAKPAKKPEA